MELAEEGVLVIAEEDVGAELDGQVVGDFVIYVRAKVGIFIRWGKIGKEGAAEVLIEQELCQAQGQQVAV